MSRFFSFVVIAFAAIAFLGFVESSDAAPIAYTATLNGPSESPPTASPGTGSAEVNFDISAHTMEVIVSFSGLSGLAIASNIQGPTPSPGTGAAGAITTLPAFPVGVTSGAYDVTFDTLLSSTYTSTFEATFGGTPAGAEAALAASLAAGVAYLNIDTVLYPGGEIRGFLTAATQSVPEPGILILLGLSIASLAGLKRRWKS